MESFFQVLGIVSLVVFILAVFYLSFGCYLKNLHAFEDDREDFMMKSFRFAGILLFPLGIILGAHIAYTDWKKYK